MINVKTKKADLVNIPWKTSDHKTLVMFRRSYKGNYRQSRRIRTGSWAAAPIDDPPTHQLDQLAVRGCLRGSVPLKVRLVSTA